MMQMLHNTKCAFSSDYHTIIISVFEITPALAMLSQDCGEYTAQLKIFRSSIIAQITTTILLLLLLSPMSPMGVRPLFAEDVTNE